MAKRKRLSPVGLSGLADMEGSGEAGAGPALRVPIAQVAGDASAHAALSELSSELESARSQGRMVQALPLAEIKADHLMRDRISRDAEDMAALKASLQARGQQTPIEVVALPEGGFGLISGFRRLQASIELFAETGEARFGSIQALIKPIDSVSDSYLAMVEENEIRSNLSFYERARLAAEAARMGVYPTAQRAVQTLFANTTPARRSKIMNFVRLHDALGDALAFPTAIPEKLGLALSGALAADAGLATRLRNALRKTPPADAAAERATIERALRKAPGGPKAPAPVEIAPGVRLEMKGGRMILSGKGVTDRLVSDLRAWLVERG